MRKWAGGRGGEHRLDGIALQGGSSAADGGGAFDTLTDRSIGNTRRIPQPIAPTSNGHSTDHTILLD
jgi:hypothetical protein